MKKIIKEFLRFLLVLCIVVLFCLIGQENICLFYTLIGILFLSLIFSAYLTGKEKVSKMWMVDILLAGVLFYGSITFLANVFETAIEKSSPNEKHQEYLIALENYKNSPIVKPNESDFSGLKIVQEGEIEKKYTKDGTIYDKNHNPINGVVIIESETSKQLLATKDGKRHGYSTFWDKENGNEVLVSDVYSINGKIIKFQEFYSNGQLRTETIFKDNIILGRHFNSAGVLQMISISNENIDKEHVFYIKKIYDKTGRLKVDFDTFNSPAWCYMNNERKRPLTADEITYLFKEEDRAAVNKGDYEINFICE